MLTNERIKKSPIQLIGVNGENLGITPTSEALKSAKRLSVDLVMMDENADPCVCKLMDYKKHLFELKRSSKKAKRPKAMKEVQFRVSISDHDARMKVERIRQFLGKGHSVKMALTWNRSSFSNVERGKTLFNDILQELGPVGALNGKRTQGMNNLSVVLNPISSASSDDNSNTVKTAATSSGHVPTRD